MDTALEYDDKKVDVSIFGDHDILIRDNDADETGSPVEIIKKGLDPFFSDHDPFEDKENIGIIVNDGDRPTPSHLVLEYLLKRYPALQRKVSMIHIATGSHKRTSGGSLKRILGGTFYILSDRINIHDGSMEADHVSVTTTSRGTDVKLDRRIMDHDLLVLINSVEPHYFAGFTGGRKSILPGMAWDGTTRRNHSHALSPLSAALALKGNPVHEDMVEGVESFLKEMDHLSIQMVQGPGKVISGVEIGALGTTFERAVARATDEFCIPIDSRYDIVVSFAKDPMDRTLYQAQKAIENGKLALKDGGTIILVASCREGIGNSTFWDLLTKSRDQEEVLCTIEKGYQLGYHKAARIASFSLHNDIYIVSTLDDDVVSKGFMTPFSTIESAMTDARDRSSANSRILVIPDGTMTVPKPPE